MKATMTLPARHRFSLVLPEPAGLLALGAVAGLLFGAISATRPEYGVYLIVAATAAAVVARWPVALAVAAVPATLLIKRFAIGSGISYSDVALAAAAGLAIPALRGAAELRRTRGALR